MKRIHLLKRDVSLEKDEITPTLEFKRKNIKKKLAALFDPFHDDDKFGRTVMDKSGES